MVITVILFLAVLAVLIFVHELGHFIVAKLCGVRVDEFCVGFPPRIVSFKKGETQYSIGLIPFGGFVKIFGENPDEESLRGQDSARSFTSVPKWKQTSILLSGIFFNLLFAWILISISFMFGSIVPIGEETLKYADYIKNPRIIITQVMSDSVAQKIGLRTGDSLIKVISDGKQYGTDDPKDISITQIQEAISSNKNTPLEIFYNRNGELLMATATPMEALTSSTSSISTPVIYEVQNGDTLNAIAVKYGFSNYKTAGIVSVPSGNLDLIRPGDLITIGDTNNISTSTETAKNNINKKIIGIYMENVGVVKLNPVLAFWEGGKITALNSKKVVTSLYDLIKNSFFGKADFSQVTGPVGIAGMINQTRFFGFSYFLGFIALISINLGIINLVPFPALDGGRVLFVAIEAVMRKEIKPIVANILNMIGFSLLILLMIVLTFKDVTGLIK